jgi:NADPH-dependent ferric siderophore reductase
MWIRLWCADGDILHQRGYTLVNPNPAAGALDIEFALHHGTASQWARAAQPGDTIDATVLGSMFAIPDPAPAGYVIVGDCASLPAINWLLTSIGDAPAQVFLEGGLRRRQRPAGGAGRRHHLGRPQERRSVLARGGVVGGF